MHWAPDMLAAAYDFLRTTMPFKKWKLPHSDEVEFQVTKIRDWRGHTEDKGDHHVLGVSCLCVSFTQTLMRTVAHEMIHVYLDRRGDGRANHGPTFRRLANLVCKHHGFDPKEF